MIFLWNSQADCISFPYRRARSSGSIYLMFATIFAARGVKGILDRLRVYVAAHTFHRACEVDVNLWKGRWVLINLVERHGVDVKNSRREIGGMKVLSLVGLKLFIMISK